MQDGKYGMTISPQEIIQRSGKWRELGVSWKEFYAAISTMLDTKKYRMMRSQNTLCLFEIIQPQVATFQVLSADDPKVLPARLMDFIKAFEKAEYKSLGYETNEIYELQVLKKTGVQMNARSVKGKDGETTYQVEIILNQEREPNAA